MKDRWKAVYGRIRRDVLKYRKPMLLFIGYYMIVKQIFRAFCPLVIMTGFPCPACGMTRAFIFLATGQFARSWNVHPMAVFWALFAIYIIVMRYFFGKQVKGFRTITALLFAAMIILYIYRMATIFPDRPPMSYTRNNMLEKLIRMWKGHPVWK